MSLILGVTLFGNLVTMTTVTVVGLPVPVRGLSDRSSNVTESADVYLACRAVVIAFCTLVSMRVLRRTQMFSFPGRLVLLPGMTCNDCRLSGLTSVLIWV